MAITENQLPLTGSSLEWAKERIDQLYDRLLPRYKVESPAPLAAWDVCNIQQKRRLKRYLEWEVASTDQQFRFQYAEKKVARTVVIGSTDPLELEISGKIDRVDSDNNGSRRNIIDYKTGKPSNKPNSFESGTSLQLPLYMLALSAMESVLLENLTAEYRHILIDGNVKQVLFGGGWVRTETETLRQIVHCLTTGITQGTFPPYPTGEKDCTYCPARTICPSERRGYAMSDSAKAVTPDLNGIRG